MKPLFPIASPKSKRTPSGEEKFLDSTHSTVKPINQQPHVRRSRRSEPDDNYLDDDLERVATKDRSALKLYLAEIGKISLLTPKEEIDLAAQVKEGNEAARHRMIRSNLRLVVKIAHDYSNFGLPLLDLISEGNIGLIKAIERFDPEKGGKLSTYAAWWIKQSIKRALANQSKTIRLPVHLVDKIAKMRHVTLQLQETLGRDPTDDEIGLEMGISVSKIAHLKTVSIRPTSLDSPAGEDDKASFGDLVGDENATSPFENLTSKNLVNQVSSMIDRLEPREAEIIKMRFGIGIDRPKTLEEVGCHFNITRERVRQIQNMAVNKIRKAMKLKEKMNTSEELHVERKHQQKLIAIQEFCMHQNN